MSESKRYKVRKNPTPAKIGDCCCLGLQYFVEDNETDMPVCECVRKAEAQLICDALNEKDGLLDVFIEKDFNSSGELRGYKIKDYHAKNVEYKYFRYESDNEKEIIKEARKYLKYIQSRYSNRYEILNSSIQGHCCIAASIIDRKKPSLGMDGKIYNYEGVCECIDEGYSKLICELLNENAIKNGDT